MTAKGDVSEDELLRLVRAPFVAGMAIALAGPELQLCSYRRGLLLL